MGEGRTSTYNETGGSRSARAAYAGSDRAGVASRTVSHQAAKRVYSELARAPGRHPRVAAAEPSGLVQVSDQGARRWVEEVLAAHPGRELPVREEQADKHSSWVR